MKILFRYDEVLEFVEYFNSLPATKRVSFKRNEMCDKTPSEILEQWVLESRHIHFRDKGIILCPSCGCGFEEVQP